VAHTYSPSYSGVRDKEAKSSQDHISTNKLGMAAQVVECLSSKHEALSSNSTARKEKRREDKRREDKKNYC
jgi:hypothetical protein